MFFERIMSMLICISTFGYYNYVVRGTHAEMTKCSCDRYQYMTYKEFYKLFCAVKWEKICSYESIGCNYPHNKFHAAIIKINGVGCVLTSYGYLRAHKLKLKKLIELQS